MVTDDKICFIFKKNHEKIYAPEGSVKIVYLQTVGKNESAPVNFRIPFKNTPGAGIVAADNALIAAYYDGDYKGLYDELTMIATQINTLIGMGVKNITLPETSPDGPENYLKNALKIYENDIICDRETRRILSLRDGVEIFDEKGNSVSHILRNEFVEPEFQMFDHRYEGYKIGISIKGMQHNIPIYSFSDDIKFNSYELHEQFVAKLRKISWDINRANKDLLQKCSIPTYSEIRDIGKTIMSSEQQTRSMQLYNKIKAPLMNIRVAKIVSVNHGETQTSEQEFNKTVKKAEKMLFPALKKAYLSGMSLYEIVDAVNTGSDLNYPVWKYIKDDFKRILASEY